MNRASRLVTVAIAVLTLLAAGTALATSVLKMSLKDLAKKSDAIVLARVENESARYEANKEIYTYYTLRVLESVKGAKSETSVTIRQLGGTVDNIASIVPGMAKFRVGEEVVVFLSQRDAAGYPWVMGLQQGKYSVISDEQGRKSVTNELEDLTVLKVDGSKATVEESARMPLQAFLDGIRTDLDEAGKVQIDPTVPTE